MQGTNEQIYSATRVEKKELWIEIYIEKFKTVAKGNYDFQGRDKLVLKALHGNYKLPGFFCIKRSINFQRNCSRHVKNH